jgi:hypothetical protein
MARSLKTESPSPDYGWGFFIKHLQRRSNIRCASPSSELRLS